MINLIIGGTGFVGRNLAKKLEAHGEQVVAIDRNYDPKRAFFGEVIIGDASNFKFLESAIRSVKPKCIFHLAANSDIRSSAYNSNLDFNDTLMTTVSLYQAVRQLPVEKIFFASSSAIYGNSTAPLSENPDELLFPISSYGKAKLTSEIIFKQLAAELSETKILIARFPNVVGSLSTHGVVYDFVHKLL